mgnify:CR=1 FL=1
MQAIVETLFDAVYLVTVITLGIIMILKSAGRRQYWLFGIMAVVLGLGDSFHLVPRALALCTTGLENYTAALGAGKLILCHDDRFLHSPVLCMEKPLSHYWEKWDNGCRVPVVCTAHCSMSLPAKRVAAPKSPSCMGNLPQHSLCAVWPAYYHTVFSGSETAA